MSDILLRTSDLSFGYPERNGLFRKPALREVIKRVDLDYFGVEDDGATPTATD